MSGASSARLESSRADEILAYWDTGPTGEIAVTASQLIDLARKVLSSSSAGSKRKSNLRSPVTMECDRLEDRRMLTIDGLAPELITVHVGGTFDGVIATFDVPTSGEANGSGSTGGDDGYGGSSDGYGGDDGYGGSSDGYGSDDGYGGSSDGYGSDDGYGGSSDGYGGDDGYGGSSDGYGGDDGGSGVGSDAYAGSPNSGPIALDYVAEIRWQDGTESLGFIRRSDSRDGKFEVWAQRSFLTEGTYSAMVTVYEYDQDLIQSGDVNFVIEVADSSVSTDEGTVRILGENLSVVEAAPFSGMVAEFTDSRDGTSPSNYTVEIDWGVAIEDQANSITSGIVTSVGPHSFNIQTSQPIKFKDEASTAPRITLTYVPDSEVTVGYSSLIVGGALIDVTVGSQTWTGTENDHLVATFQDPTPNGEVEVFEAQINWGDGFQSTVTPTWNSIFSKYEVWASHGYEESGSYPIGGDYSLEVRVFEVEGNQLGTRGSGVGTIVVPESAAFHEPNYVGTPWGYYMLPSGPDGTYGTVYTALEQYIAATGVTLEKTDSGIQTGNSWAPAPLSDIVAGEQFTANLGTLDFKLQNTVPGAPVTVEYYVGWYGEKGGLFDGPYFTTADAEGEISLTATHTYLESGHQDIVVSVSINYYDIAETPEYAFEPRFIGSAYEFRSGVVVAEKLPLAELQSIPGSADAHSAVTGATIEGSSLFSVTNVAKNAIGIIEWGDGEIDVFDIVDDTIPASVNHAYNTGGNFTARLTIRQGTVGDSVDVEIAITPNSSDLSLARDLSVVAENFVVEENQDTSSIVLATIVDDSPLHIGGSHVVQINWGDGTVSKGILERDELDNQLVVKGDHSYRSAGLYAVQIYYKSQLREVVRSVTAKVTPSEFTLTDLDLTIGSESYTNLLVGEIDRPSTVPVDNLLPASHYRAVIDWGNGERADAFIAGSGHKLYVYADVSTKGQHGSPDISGKFHTLDFTGEFAPRLIVESGYSDGHWKVQEGSLEIVPGTAGFVESIYLGNYRVWGGYLDGVGPDPYGGFLDNDQDGLGTVGVVNGHEWSLSHDTVVTWGDGTPLHELRGIQDGGNGSPETQWWFGLADHRFEHEISGTDDATEFLINGQTFAPNVQIADGLIYELQVRDTLYGQQETPLTDVVLARISGSEFANSEFTITVDWGDGSPTVGQTSDNDDNTLDVEGSHTYGKAGQYDVTVLIESDGGTTRVVRTKAVISAVLSGEDETWAAAVDESTGEMLVYTIPAAVWNPPDELTSTTAGSVERKQAIDDFQIHEWFTGAIEWGDGTAPDDVLLQVDENSLDLLVHGRHTYEMTGSFEFQLELLDASETPFRYTRDITVYDNWEIDGHRNTTGFDEAAVENLGQASYSVNTGGIYIAHQLDLDVSPGFGGQFLVYNSDTTDIQPVVEAEVTLGDGLLNTAASFIAEARLFWEGEAVSDWVTFGADQAFQTLDSVVLAAESTINVVLSGIYDWELQVRVDLDGDSNDDSSPWLYIADSGSTEVVVRDPEADEPEVPDEIGFYGAGWWLDFQDRLFITDNDLFAEDDNDLVWATGTGGTKHLTIHEADREPWEKQRLWELDQKAYKARYNSDVEPPEIQVIRYDVPITTSGSSNDVGSLNLYLERPDDFRDPFETSGTESEFDRPFFEFEDRHKTKLYFNEYGLLIGRVLPSELEDYYNESGELKLLPNLDGPREYYEYDDQGRLTTVHAVDHSTSTVTYAGLYVDEIKSPGNRTVTLNGTKTITSIDDVDGTSRSFEYDATHQNHIDKITWHTLVQEFEFDDLKRVKKIKLGEGSDWEIETRESRILEDEKALQILPSAFDPVTADLIPHAAFAIVTDPSVGSATNGTVSAWLQNKDGKAEYFGKPDGRTDASANRVWESIWSDFDDFGNALRYEDPSMVETYAYNINQQLVSAELVGVGIRSWEYDPDFAHVTKFTNRNGNSTYSTYWADTGLIKSIKNDEQTTGTQYTYSAAGLLQTLTDPRGYTTDYLYDGNRRLQTTFHDVSLGQDVPGQNSTSTQLIATHLTYDAFGNVRTATNPLGEVSNTFFDARGRLEKTTDGEGTTFEVHSFFDHGPAEEFTQSGIKSKISIDSRGWQTTVEEGFGTPDARSFQTAYNLDGTVATTTNAVGRITSYEYDTLDRLIEISSDSGVVEHYFDAQGNVHYTQEALVKRPVRHRNYRYNLQNLLINEYIADQELLSVSNDFVGPIQHSPLVSLIYNNEGGLLESKDSRSNSTVWTYDSAERIDTTTDRAGHVTTNFYDESGNLIKVEGPEGSKTEWSYDEANRPYETIQYADQTAHVSRTFYNEGSQVVASYTPEQWLFQDAFGNGNFSSFEYDTRGRVTKQTDAEGRDVSYGYEDASGNDDKNLVHSVTDYLSRTDVFEFDALGRKKQHTNSASEVFKWEYDAVGRIVKQELPMDSLLGLGSHLATTTAYDDVNLKVTATGLDGSTSTTEFDGAGNTIKVTDRRGNSTQFIFDSYNRMNTMQLPGTISAPSSAAAGLTAASWLFSHDFNGNVTSTTDPDGNVVDFQYDEMDRQEQVSQYVTQYDPVTGNDIPTTIQTDTTYTGLGQVNTITTPVGTTTNTYDEMGRLRTSTNAESETTEWQYDLDSRVRKTVDALQNERQFGFDFIGRGTSYIDPILKETITQYSVDTTTQSDVVQTTDPENNARKSSHGPAGTTSKTEYGINNSGAFNVEASTESQTDSLGFAAAFSSDQDDVAGLETSHTTYNPVTRTKTIKDAEGHETVQTFDANGNMVTVKDPNNLTTTYVYDERNQMVEKQEPSGVNTVFEYDQLGRVVAITDAENNQTSFEYDEIGRKSAEINQLLAIRSYDYDSGSRLVRQTDRDDRITEYSYDNVDRLLAETWLDSSGTASHTITFAWNDVGQLTSASDVFSSYSFYAYDDNGMLKASDVSITGLTVGIGLFNDYDDAQNRTKLDVVLDATLYSTTDYEYDYLGRVEKIEQSGATLKDKEVHLYHEGTGALYYVQGFVDGGYAHTLETHYDYFKDGTLKEILHFGESGLLDFTHYTYEYDDGNRITNWKASDTHDDLTNLKFGTTVGYDDLGQVTSADHLSQTDENYSYDDTGNRDSHTISTNNRLESDGVYNYEHDDEGNRTKRTAISNGDYITYTWDHRNRLTDVDHFLANGTQTKSVDYTYDAFNRRVSKKVDDTADGIVDDGEFYVYDESPYSDLDDVLMTFDLNSNVKRTNLNGTDVDQLFASEDATGEVLWPLTDHQGTVREVVEMSDSTDVPEIVETITYGAFGNIVSVEDETGASVAEPTLSATYTGREWDADAQLFFYRARWYDAETGRFVSEDPMGFAAGDANLSRYVGNGSYNATDPSGMKDRRLDSLFDWRVLESSESDQNEALAKTSTRSLLNVLEYDLKTEFFPERTWEVIADLRNGRAFMSKADHLATIRMLSLLATRFHHYESGVLPDTSLVRLHHVAADDLKGSGYVSVHLGDSGTEFLKRFGDDDVESLLQDEVWFRTTVLRKVVDELATRQLKEGVSNAVTGALNEPYDWMMTAREVYNEPTNPLSYAGFVPFAPASAKRIFGTSSKYGRNFDNVFGAAPNSLARKGLPHLKGSVADAFDGVRLRTFKKGDKVYRSPSADELGRLEPPSKPGAWFSTRRTTTKAGTESQSNVVKWDNPLEELRRYEFTEDVTVYYGKVAGGNGYQLLFPRDVVRGDVLKFVPPPTPLK